ncbi:hypothetical protein BJ138DRAFT_1226745 [Hygrophoropsis aurantiaca]|uniref:Uncharacterized protein n=1 Tax=Hygrophoropsis aurantiaca TaxID=72124 RepID=A0ACB8AI50_9AGAM|nr:hypothetical protein BJ138DRAFT_1226745 [Hygrophoropsis aurantiaca]
MTWDALMCAVNHDGAKNVFTAGQPLRLYHHNPEPKQYSAIWHTAVESTSKRTLGTAPPLTLRNLSIKLVASDTFIEEAILYQFIVDQLISLLHSSIDLAHRDHMQTHSRRNLDSSTGNLNSDHFIVISRHDVEAKMNPPNPMDRLYDDILLLCFENAIQSWEHCRLCVVTHQGDLPVFGRDNGDGDNEFDSYDGYEPVIEALLTASHRIAVMSIQSSENIVRELLPRSAASSLSACSQLFRALAAITITNPLGAEPLDYDQFQALLKNSPNLRHLTVHALAITRPYNLGISHGEIPTLERLSFIAPSYDDWSFFAFLSVPNVCQITLSNLAHIGPTDTYRMFFEKNDLARFPKVATLTLENFHSQRDDVADLFASAFPNITSLTIDVPSLTSLAFGHYREDASGIPKITSDASDKTLPTWPYMQHLTLDYRAIYWAPHLSVVCCWLGWRQSEAKCSLRIYITGVTAARSKVGDAVFSTHLKKLQQYGKLENMDIQDIDKDTDTENIWDS